MATGLDAGRHLVVGSMAPRVATPRAGSAMPSIVDVVMVSAGMMGSILEEVSRKGAARVLVEVGIHIDSMCLCLRVASLWNPVSKEHKRIYSNTNNLSSKPIKVI